MVSGISHHTYTWKAHALVPQVHHIRASTVLPAQDLLFGVLPTITRNVSSLGATCADGPSHRPLNLNICSQIHIIDTQRVYTTWAQTPQVPSAYTNMVASNIDCSTSWFVPSTKHIDLRQRHSPPLGTIRCNFFKSIRFQYHGLCRTAKVRQQPPA